MTGPRLPARQGAHSCEQFTGRVEALSDPLIMKGSSARAHTHTCILTGMHVHARRQTHAHLFADVYTGVTAVFRQIY